MTKDLIQQSEFLFYTSPEGDIKIDVFYQDETVWLTQKKMAGLFGVEVNTVNYHLKEIFKNGELKENSVIRKIRITAKDGKDYDTQFYNLDAIIAVGYRVNSSRATQFRIWATRTLREYIIKGFAIDSDRLKNANKPHMGMTTWKNSPKGKILKPDISIAKNYLNEKELRQLNRIVNMYLDYAELQAERQIPMKMNDWSDKLDAFLKFNEYDILNSPGKVSAKIAKNLAETEYEKFRVIQDKEFESDFDKEAKKLLRKKS